ncbi:hypothetical protein HSX37_05635|uniref:Uncharacterized protein n=1 Tax=Dendrosporobacter quercicolus TaxID=146817 RepID=A0A1G9P2G9_9FIRM|nr:hypothetical protein [Dendrosporobacter quercicolus]NSL47524.1 hypothetical protein [Dendrosporobacter quercicolus DSM 1736]SDL92859.1 hypothetical protein SAMN04488502_1011204 [Dendrosporobacter quercicolus]
MTLPEFPEIQQPCYPFSSEWEDPALTSKMENGYIVSRPKFTRVRETFRLKWQALPARDYHALRTFWKDVVLGGSREFYWTYPEVPDDAYSKKVFTVRFISGEIRFDLVGPGQYSGEFKLQEV